MRELCDLKVHINEHTFLLHQRVLCSFSAQLKKMVKQEKRRSGPNGSGIEISGFPGGPSGFELISRFCYNNGRIAITSSNICLLHCSATFLEMTEGMANCNLLSQTDSFLEELLHWPWSEVITALKSCELFLPAADSCGLLQRLISALLSKISFNSGLVVSSSSSASSSSSSPDINLEWWFDDLTVLAPTTIETMMKTLGAYGAENNNLILTRFLLHYLKTALQKKPCCKEEQYSSLADTAVYGVVLIGRTGFSCRRLFWVMRVVSGLGLSKECRHRLEGLMGLMLEQATLDDLLVSGDGAGVYDVNLVLRLVRTFVSSDQEGGLLSLQRMNKVGRLIDKYLCEISPDQSLKVSKFLEVAESLPDAARNCFDGAYRAVDIYLQSHPTLSTEERTRLCACLNYEKLTLEACKDLAKNRRIPAEVAVEALVSQQFGNSSMRMTEAEGAVASLGPAGEEEEEELRFDLQRVQRREKELERARTRVKGRPAKGKPAGHGGRAMPRLC